MKEFSDYLNRNSVLLALGLVVTIFGITGINVATFFGSIGAAIAGILVLLFIIISFFQDRKKTKTSTLLDKSDNEVEQELRPQNRKKFKAAHSLLPYLPNMSEQENSLNQAIRNWKTQHQNKKYHPFIYLMCGNTKDDGQLEKRWKKYLSALFSDKDNTLNEEMYLGSNEEIMTIPLKATENFYCVTHLYEAIWEKLKESYLPSCIDEDWKDKMVRKLVGEQRLIFIYVMIDMTQWRNQNRTINEFIRKFIYFWYDNETHNAWMEIPGLEHNIIICLFFRYNSYKLLNVKCQKSLFPEEGIDLVGFQNKYQAKGVILPPLSGVEKNHVVDDWIRDYEKTISLYRNDIENIKNEIDKLYMWRKTIPLGKLGPKLQKILLEN